MNNEINLAVRGSHRDFSRIMIERKPHIYVYCIVMELLKCGLVQLVDKMLSNSIKFGEMYKNITVTIWRNIFLGCTISMVLNYL